MQLCFRIFLYFQFPVSLFIGTEQRIIVLQLDAEMLVAMVCNSARSNISLVSELGEITDVCSLFQLFSSVNFRSIMHSLCPVGSDWWFNWALFSWQEQSNFNFALLELFCVSFCWQKSFDALHSKINVLFAWPPGEIHCSPKQLRYFLRV